MTPFYAMAVNDLYFEKFKLINEDGNVIQSSDYQNDTFFLHASFKDTMGMFQAKNLCSECDIVYYQNDVIEVLNTP